MKKREESKLKNIGLQFFAEPGQAAETTPTEPVVPTSGDTTTNVPTSNNPDAVVNEPKNDDIANETSAEIERLRAELARNKKALDNATKEAAEYKKTIRKNQSEEERRAEEERERQEAIENELKTLRKQSAVAVTAKKVMTFIADENAATTVAESLYGAEDIDAAVDEIQKAWTAHEKKLRMEYGKIPAPGAGNEEEDKKKANVEYARSLGKAKADSLKNTSEGLNRFKIR